MSSWKKASKSQKTHRERHQPESRQHLGLLEKRKDYQARSRDYHRKQATLKNLRKRALYRNPDEFRFHMINSKLEDGEHREKRREKCHTEAQLKLMATQDLRYVSYRRNVEAKKVRRCQSSLHMIDIAEETPNRHTFFVDDDEEIGEFDLARRLDTHPALLARKTNRMRLTKLKETEIPQLDDKAAEKLEKLKAAAYKELGSRIARETELSVVQRKLELERALKNKKTEKPKMIRAASKDAAAIYKWKYERKR